MAKYIISYDLRKPERDYQPLYAELDILGAARIQESVWAVRTRVTAQQIFDVLWRHMHSQKDRLLVAELDGSNNITNKNAFNRLGPV